MLIFDFRSFVGTLISDLDLLVSLNRLHFLKGRSPVVVISVCTSAWHCTNSIITTHRLFFQSVREWVVPSWWLTSKCSRSSLHKEKAFPAGAYKLLTILEGISTFSKISFSHDLSQNFLWVGDSNRPEVLFGSYSVSAKIAWQVIFFKIGLYFKCILEPSNRSFTKHKNSSDLSLLLFWFSCLAQLRLYGTLGNKTH